MSVRTKTIAGILMLAVFIWGAVFLYNYLSGRTEAPDATSAENEKIPAPDFTVLDSDGNEVKLSEMFGKPLVVNFWASWCPPCKSEMPEFNKVYEEMGEDVTFMMINLVDGQRETVETGKEFIAGQGFTFPVYYDTEGEAGYIYGIASIPTTLFIDRNGYIVTGAQGMISGEILREGISAAE